MNLELCPVCGNISENEREEFYRSLKVITKSYFKGDFIAHQGDTVDSLLLLSGKT